MQKINTKKIVEGAVIGALYVVLTLVLAPFSFGPVQLRVSEALCILPVFSKNATLGLFIGCTISNFIGATMGINLFIDILFGSAATLIGAIFTQKLGPVKIKNFPAFSFLPPILFNALIIGAELSLFLDSSLAFSYAAFTVGAGEFLSVCGLGIPLYFVVKKMNIFN